MNYLIIADYPYDTTKKFFEKEPDGQETERFINFQSNRLLQQRCYLIKDYKKITDEKGRISYKYNIIERIWLK